MKQPPPTRKSARRIAIAALTALAVALLAAPAAAATSVPGCSIETEPLYKPRGFCEYAACSNGLGVHLRIWIAPQPKISKPPCP